MPNSVMHQSDMVSLHEHMDAMIVALDKRIQEKFMALEKAVALAEEGEEKWRANANEWRAAMSDRESQFVQKSSYDVIAKRIDDLERKADIAQGKASMGAVVFSTAIAVVGVILGVIHLFK